MPPSPALTRQREGQGLQALQEFAKHAALLMRMLANNGGMNQTAKKIRGENGMLNHATGRVLISLALGLSTLTARAETRGITDTEIKIGQNAAFSGPASVYGQISTAESHYFQMINDQGGI